MFISYKEPEDRAIAEKAAMLAKRAGFIPYIAPADIKTRNKNLGGKDH